MSSNLIKSANCPSQDEWIRVWLASGELTLGDTIMQVLIGGDIRPHVIDVLQTLVGKIKNECVVEEEKY